jgi:putative FmdB family regulatory protein
MPIYEYKCAECGKRVERMQKISDEPLTVCETCGGRLEKQWSLSGFQFKGAGWYVTDYSNKTKETATAGNGETKEKGAKAENAEKTSAAESTAAPEGASNKANDTVAAAETPKKDTVAKKD